MFKAILIGGVLGLLGAVLTDLQAYARARSADPKAAFDWQLLAVRAGIGFASGALANTAIEAI